VPRYIWARCPACTVTQLVDLLEIVYDDDMVIKYCLRCNALLFTAATDPNSDAVGHKCAERRATPGLNNK
jgi:hypothetical protein